MNCNSVAVPPWSAQPSLLAVTLTAACLQRGFGSTSVPVSPGTLAEGGWGVWRSRCSACNFSQICLYSVGSEHILCIWPSAFEAARFEFIFTKVSLTLNFQPFLHSGCMYAVYESELWYKLEYFLLFLLWRPEWSLLRMVSLNQAETWTRQRTTAHHMFPFKNEKIQWWSNTNNQINETLRSRKNIFNRTLRLSLLNKH